MYDRPWHDVVNFYSNLVNGRFTLSTLFGTETCIEYDSKTEEVSDEKEERGGRWERVTFRIIVSYNGGAFDGWQKQPGLNTVQEMVERSLGRFVDEKKAQLLKEKSKPLEGCAVVAGRTDKGVSAIRQVCSFYTWRKDVKPCDIEDSVNSMAPGKLRVVSVSEVSRVFHPNFSAKWRRYLYIFPLNDQDFQKESCENEEEEHLSTDGNYNDPRSGSVKNNGRENGDNLIISNNDGLEAANKPTCFSVCRVNQLLRQLEGKLLSYKMFARDTKASRNMGPPTECFMYRARAAEARIPYSDHKEGRKVMCVELVANRFLRKMVRVLVATSIREAAAGAEEDALLKLMEATCRRATAPPAPPDGLCLVDVGYTDFDAQNCLIL
ncbi:Pseudouridine synthase I, TruA [Corchorus olitorius]|uniref:tRNA pseudouridine synthase n=1 Tax=Corchorus olitorius TaxID=93759 RepID=A0A1R3IGX6_9ROSI|nr:Pseudouridine synthase I, TruA [Corchorus olitorius]